MPFFAPLIIMQMHGISLLSNGKKMARIFLSSMENAGVWHKNAPNLCRYSNSISRPSAERCFRAFFSSSCAKSLAKQKG